MCSYTACALLNWRLRSKSSAKLFILPITASPAGTRRKRSKAMSSWPWPCSAKPIMRLVSADSSSDLALPSSVIKKRLVVSAKWPMSSRVAGSTSLIHKPAEASMPPSSASSTTKSTAVITAAMPADKRGRAAIKYAATTKNASIATQMPQLGCTMKCSLKMLDVMCAMVSTGVRLGWPGVANCVPTPAAVAPISTILSAYLDAGILPLATS